MTTTLEPPTATPDTRQWPVGLTDRMTEPRREALAQQWLTRGKQRRTVRPPNAVLAYEVLDLIKASPEALDMNDWVGRVEDRWDDPTPVTFGELNDCGTKACFAGWTVLHRGYGINPSVATVVETGELVPDMAQQLLNLNNFDAFTLFNLTGDDDLEDRIHEVFGPDPRLKAVS